MHWLSCERHWFYFYVVDMRWDQKFILFYIIDLQHALGFVQTAFTPKVLPIIHSIQQTLIIWKLSVNEAVQIVRVISTAVTANIIASDLDKQSNQAVQPLAQRSVWSDSNEKISPNTSSNQQTVACSLPQYREKTQAGGSHSGGYTLSLACQESSQALWIAWMLRVGLPLALNITNTLDKRSL